MSDPASRSLCFLSSLLPLTVDENTTTTTTMKLSDIDLDLDAVDAVRLAFLAATAGVSMHSHLRPRLSPG